jgi:SEC-C motif domain protein
LAALEPNKPCPCGSGTKYKKCCRPYHKGMLPPTPEALMRSRYTAYVADDMAYIAATTHPESPWFREDVAASQRELQTLTANRRYDQLGVLSAEVAADGTTGYVTFRATITNTKDGSDLSFSEKSEFKKQDGRWLYVGGDIQS